MEILIQKIDERAVLPAYETDAASGLKLRALDAVIVEPGQTVSIPTGIAMALSVGYVGHIWNREIMVTNEHIRVNSSMIDSSYREEIKVEVSNTGSEAHTVEAGDVIAQILVHQIYRPHIIEAEDVSSANHH
jgi:dUTP pyrophosphatase